MTYLEKLCACGILLWTVSIGTIGEENVTMKSSWNESSVPRERQDVMISEEKRLTQYLLWRYSVAGRGGRPVINTSSTPTLVEFGLGLIQMDLDERSKILMTSMWTRLKWQDMYLTWDPVDFGGVGSVRLEADQVWLPDIMLYNTADPENAARNALVVVFHDGTLQWVPHQIFKSSCSINVTNFPFDQQQCHMWFGSWTHSVKDIDLNLAFHGGIDLGTFQSDYKDSCEWDIVQTEAERMLLPEDDPNPIVVLSFTLHLQRKLVFSSYILTLPCVFLASLTLVVFWLPPDRPDRTSLAMNLFASFLVLLLILVEAAPPTASSVPLIGVYYCFNMVIIMMSIFLSTMVVNLSRAGNKGKPVPRWLRVIVLQIVAKFVCIWTPCCLCGKPGHCRKYSVSHAQHNDITNQSCDKSTPETRQLLRDNCDERSFTQGHHDNSFHAQELDNQYVAVHKQLVDIYEALQHLVKNVTHKDKQMFDMRQVTLEWQEVARVLDRFFFVLYICLIVLSLLILFPRPPLMKFFWES